MYRQVLGSCLGAEKIVEHKVTMIPIIEGTLGPILEGSEEASGIENQRKNQGHQDH